MAELDLSTLSPGNLEEALREVHGQIMALKTRKRAIAAALDALAVKSEIARALSGLSDKAKAVIGMKGIEPGGAVGTPGAA